MEAGRSEGIGDCRAVDVAVCTPRGCTFKRPRCMQCQSIACARCLGRFRRDRAGEESGLLSASLLSARGGAVAGRGGGAVPTATARAGAAMSPAPLMAPCPLLSTCGDVARALPCRFAGLPSLRASALSGAGGTWAPTVSPRSSVRGTLLFVSALWCGLLPSLLSWARDSGRCLLASGSPPPSGGTDGALSMVWPRCLERDDCASDPSTDPSRMTNARMRALVMSVPI